MEEKKDIKNIEEVSINEIDDTIDIQSTFNADTIEELNDADVILELNSGHFFILHGEVILYLQLLFPLKTKIWNLF